MAFRKGHQKVPGSGRQLGTTNKNTAPIKALALKAAPDVINELARLALHSTNEAVRVAAGKELLDRAIGKAVQPVSADAATPASDDQLSLEVLARKVALAFRIAAMKQEAIEHDGNGALPALNATAPLTGMKAGTTR